MSETITQPKPDLITAQSGDVVHMPSTKLRGGLLPEGARAVSNPEANIVQVLEINPTGQIVRSVRKGHEVRADLANPDNHLHRQYS